ncbi:MAG: outer membrane beta-barrel protein [Fluviicola sp.]
MKTQLIRLLSLSALILLCHQTCFAQRRMNERANRMENRFGLKLGGGISWLNDFTVADPNTILNPAIGFAGHFGAPNKPVTLTTELYYTRKGARINYDLSETYTGNSRMHLHYLELPVLANIHVGKIVRLQLGGYGGLLFGKNQTYPGTFYNDATGISFDDMNTIDYGLSGGIAFDLRRSQLSMRYNHSLNTLAATENGETYLGNASLGVFEFSITKYFMPRTPRNRPRRR